LFKTRYRHTHILFNVILYIYIFVHSDWRDWFILALKRTEQKERKKTRRIELKKQQQKKHKLFRLQ